MSYYCKPGTVLVTEDRNKKETNGQRGDQDGRVGGSGAHFPSKTHQNYIYM